MRQYDLLEFFSLIGYDYKKDLEKLGEVCRYTKTRVKEGMDQSASFVFSRGMEQTFFIKSILEWARATSFFEIGTGRGTASYAASIISEIKRITTFDIVPFEHKTNTAIDYKPAFVSNKDIYDKIPFSEKTKIQFLNVRDSLEVNEHNKYDVCFIDGNHDDARVIVQDYIKCKKVMKEGGIILWDDYDQDRFSVKKVVDALLEKEEDLDAIWVHTRGHLFGDDKEADAGIVVMKKGKLL